MLVCCLLIGVIFIMFTGTPKTVLMCVVFIFTFVKLFNVDYYMAFLGSVVYTILTIIPDLFVMFFSIYVLGMTKEFYYSNFAGSILCNLFVTIVMTLVTYLLRKVLKKFFTHKISSNKRIIILSIASVIAMALFFYKFLTIYEFGDDIILYLSAILVFPTILFFVFKQNYENNSLKNKYDDLLNIMKNYESDIEEQRTIVHETRNEFMTIKSKLEDNNKKEEIIKYINSVIGDKITPSSSKHSKFKYLPQNGLRGFFYYKFLEAEKRGLNVSINISSRIEKSFLKDIDTKDFKNLVRIIGVYLDNAFEASSISKEKKVGIELYLIKNDISIIITNTFSNLIDKERIGQVGFSTKSKKRGHGLHLVDSIISSNKIFTQKTEINDNLFIQNLIVKCSTK